MNKISHLQEKAAKFRDLLKEYESADTNAYLLLKWLTPLFDDIEAGKIHPPVPYEFKMALGKDDPFYEPDKPFFAAEADFIAALEDWQSREFFQNFIKH